MNMHITQFYCFFINVMFLVEFICHPKCTSWRKLHFSACCTNDIFVDILYQALFIPCLYTYFCNRIIADNIDHNVYARIQTKDNSNQSIHWTHQFAMLEKAVDMELDDSNPQKAVKDLQLMELLPDQDVQQNLVWQWAVLVSRVITKYLPAFKWLQSDVIRHIPHKYSNEMAKQSETVSLFLNLVVL